MSRPVDDWQAKAKFMRDTGAVHAEWVFDGWDGDRSCMAERLTKLVLGPVPVAKPVAQPKADPTMPKGAVARLMKQHEIQFAHSRVRPPLPMTPENDVPRAVAAKKAASHGTKAQKRAS